ncbi:MAG: hypothetical protein U9R34_04440 [Nanoarchaeota archaeon]|nr:hypothetical protein [Nanoarchaeota archaeon]
MAEIKSIGTEYQIIAEGTWEQVAEACRITKTVIKETQPNTCFFNSREIEAIKSALTKYLTPKEKENFADYKNRVSEKYSGIKEKLNSLLTENNIPFTGFRHDNRFVAAYSETGIKGKLKSLLIRNKVPFHFNLIEFKGENTLKVESITREKEYQATISASGDYSKRGDSIATGLKEALELNSIPYSYKTLDKLI